MTNKDYQELKSKIQDACPSLLELTFGCSVGFKIRGEKRRPKILRRMGKLYVIYNSREDYKIL